MWSALYQVIILPPVNAFMSCKSGGQIFEFVRVCSYQSCLLSDPHSVDCLAMAYGKAPVILASLLRHSFCISPFPPLENQDSCVYCLEMGSLHCVSSQAFSRFCQQTQLGLLLTFLSAEEVNMTTRSCQILTPRCFQHVVNTVYSGHSH